MFELGILSSETVSTHFTYVGNNFLEHLISQFYNFIVWIVI